VSAELARQQALLEALFAGGGQVFRPDPAFELSTGRDALEYGVRSEDLTPKARRGLQAYRANAGAAAERALASAFPVVQALVGAESFASLARAFWQAQPPARGDLAWLGAGLAGFLERDPQLADVPYLADVARLEWLLARAEIAPDAPGSASERLASLQVLADFAPRELFISLAPGAAVLRSAWPIASVWQAHRPGAPAAAFDDARARVAGRSGETVFVWRPEWVGRVEVVDEASACFLEALLEGSDLARAMADATRVSADWSFEAWLARAIGVGWLAWARHGPAPPGGS